MQTKVPLEKGLNSKRGEEFEYNNVIYYIKMEKRKREKVERSEVKVNLMGN